MKVLNLMSHRPQAVRSQDTLLDAAKLMKKLNIGFLLVAKDDDLVGVITDRDIVTRCVSEGRDPTYTRVGELMSSPVFYCYESTDLIDAIQIMEEKQLRRLVVRQHDTELVTGVISIDDIARIARREATGELLFEVIKKKNA
jgi:CBS domain-containing protein